MGWLWDIMKIKPKQNKLTGVFFHIPKSSSRRTPFFPSATPGTSWLALAKLPLGIPERMGKRRLFVKSNQS